MRNKSSLNILLFIPSDTYATFPIVPERVSKICPIKCCSVALSEIVSHGKRLEAGVFDIEAKLAWEEINSGKYGIIPLCGKNGIANAYMVNRFKRVLVEHSQYPIYQPSAITDINPIPYGYLAEGVKANIDELRIKTGRFAT